MSHLSTLFSFMQTETSDAPSLDFSSSESISEFVQYYSTQAMEQIIVFAPRIIVALLVLMIGMNIAGRVYRGLKKRLGKAKNVDDTLGNFFANMAKYAIVAGTLLAAVGIVGIPVARIFVILSAATLAIGLALQGSLSNVAAGLLLIVLRPFQIGDYVELAGEEGTVEDLNIFTTTLRTLDNIKVIVSNGEVRGNTIKNFSTLGVRRVDVDFGIDYNDDIDKAMKIILDTAGTDGRVLNDPDGPWARVSNLNDSSVDIQMRVWCKVEDYWDVRFDLIKAVKEAFDKGGITIPYPHVVEIEKT